MTSSAVTPASIQRDLRIDFFRGLALVLIFLDHVPDNWLGEITSRNMGLSDAAEIFVFLAGYAAALVYQQRYLAQGSFVASLYILRRTWTLYVAHIFLLAQLMAVIFVVNDFVPTKDFIDDAGLGYFVSHPAKALVEALLLRFKPMLMDPLPLYMVLLGTLAMLLPLAINRPRRLLLLSATIYVAAITSQWNFNAQPDGHWFFNPLAWQFLFFIGVVCGAHRQIVATMINQLNRRLRRFIAGGLITFLGLSALLVISWHWPAWHDRWMPQWIAHVLYPIDKTNVSPIRILHFMALALCVAMFLPQGRWLQSRIARAIRLMGRHSLIVFCLSVLLVPIADCINTLSRDSLIVQTLTSIAGIGLMMLIAMLPEWFAAQEKVFRERRHGTKDAMVNAPVISLRANKEITNYSPVKSDTLLPRAANK